MASDERRSPPIARDDSAFEAPAEPELILELSRPAPRAPAAPPPPDLPPEPPPPPDPPPAPDSDPPARCRRHPELMAGWWCRTCGALCPSCMAMQRLSTRRAMAGCGWCGGARQ